MELVYIIVGSCLWGLLCALNVRMLWRARGQESCYNVRPASGVADVINLRTDNKVSDNVCEHLALRGISREQWESAKAEFRKREGQMVFSDVLCAEER